MSILSKWLKVTLGVAVFALSGTAYAAAPLDVPTPGGNVDMTVTIGDGTTNNGVSVAGGDGAASGVGADNNVVLSQGADTTKTGTLNVEGGAGSNDNAGGNALVTLDGDVYVTDVDVIAGAKTTNNGGTATFDGDGNTLHISGSTFGVTSTDSAVSVTNVGLDFLEDNTVTFVAGAANATFEVLSTTVAAGKTVAFADIDNAVGGFEVGDVSLLGGSTLTFAGADASAGIGNVAVVGTGNTITNNTNVALGMQQDMGLTFDLDGADFTGSDAMLTVTTGGLTGHADGTAIALTNVDKAGYGGTVKLLNVATDGTVGFTDGGTKIEDDLQIDGVTAGDATYGYKYDYASDADMSLRVNKVEGANAAITLASTVSVEADDVVDVGSVTLESGAGYTAVDGAIFKASNLNIAAGSTSALTLVANTTTPDNVSFGEITMGDGATLNLVSGVAGTNFEWTGGLTVNNTGTLAGAWALEGKELTAIIDSGYSDGDAILALGANATVDDTTTVNLIVDATARSVADDLSDDAALQNVLDGTTEIVTGDNVEDLDGATINVESQGIGTMAGTGVLAADGKVNAADGPIVMALQGGDDSAVYNASLSMPALMSLVNVGADTAERATGGFTPMALRGAGFSGSQFGMYASMGASSIELETGSGVDSDSFNLLIGPGLRINNGTGRTDIGAFFEAGWGSYDAFNGAFRGEGETEYYGGGLLLRHDTCFGLYGEASLRFGTATTDYNRADVDFELDSSYWGGHLGIGYIFKPSECTTLDVFAKGLMTSLDGADTEDGNGRFEIDDTDSYRTQMGAKYSYNFSESASLYAKGAWEYEFDGETGGSYAGQRFAKNADPSGSSFIGEVGVDVRLTERVTLGGSIYGIVGQREGFGGSLSLAIGF